MNNGTNLGYIFIYSNPNFLIFEQKLDQNVLLSFPLPNNTINVGSYSAFVKARSYQNQLLLDQN
jgi:hypothetical protein